MENIRSGAKEEELRAEHREKIQPRNRRDSCLRHPKSFSEQIPFSLETCFFIHLFVLIAAMEKGKTQGTYREQTSIFSISCCFL